MFFNQIPQGGPPGQMPMPPPGGMPGAPMLPPGPPMPPPQGMQPPMMPPGMGMPPGMAPLPPGGGQQGTPGLDILKLLMMMKQKGVGPMSGGVGDVPPLSLDMPYSMTPGGDASSGLYGMIAKLLGQSGQGT